MDQVGLALGLSMGVQGSQRARCNLGPASSTCLLEPGNPPYSVLLTQSFREIAELFPNPDSLPGPAGRGGGGPDCKRCLALGDGTVLQAPLSPLPGAHAPLEDAIHYVTTRWRSCLLFLWQKAENTKLCVYVSIIYLVYLIAA